MIPLEVHMNKENMKNVIILKELPSNLIDEAKNKRLAFQLGTVERYYDVYKEVKNSYIK